ncbi:unnamed protein product, partial [Polarella glacialis]
MGTSDIALERVQALLKVDSGNGSMYNHLVRTVRLLAADKPENALAQLETLSRQLKESAFSGAPAPEQAEESIAAVAAEEQRKRWALQSLQLLKSPSDHTATPKVLAAVQNFLEDASMFEWAGVGFGRQESFHIAMSLRKLAAETPALDSFRLWGKLLGTEGDYLVAEGVLKMPPGGLSAGAAMPGTPEYDVEERGEGANSCSYWVSSGASAGWVRLPSARASQIAAARNIKRMLTGSLNSSVPSTPWFPGTEQHLLRVQIARISSTCTLAAKGWYEPDEESGIKNKIKMVDAENLAFPASEELATQDGWVHASPFLLSNGKSTWPDLEALGEKLTEEQTAEISAQAEAEPEHAMLEGITEDLAELKPEDAEGGSPAWSIKVYGDEGVYDFGENGGAKTYRVTAVRSTIWPGAVTVAQ